MRPRKLRPRLLVYSEVTSAACAGITVPANEPALVVVGFWNVGPETVVRSVSLMKSIEQLPDTCPDKSVVTQVSMAVNSSDNSARVIGTLSSMPNVKIQGMACWVSCITTSAQFANGMNGRLGI